MAHSSSGVPTIHDLRITLVYTETIPGGLRGELATAPYGFLFSQFSYAQAFANAAAGPAGGLQLPWAGHGRSFWHYYFDCRRRLDGVTGHQAWRAAAPLRTLFPTVVTAPLLPCAVQAEAFVYPHGLAIAVSLVLQTPMTVLDAAALAVELRRTPQFITAANANLRLIDAIAREGLDALRTTAFGRDAPQGERPFEPFSVVTVVRAKDVDPTQQFAGGGDEQRFLEAVTTWSKTWQSAALPQLAQATVASRTGGAAPGDILYGHKRARAIWFPGSSTMARGLVHTLACYHRNLVLASMQVESLAAFTQATARFLPPAGTLPGEHYAAARRAGLILGRFYGGTPDIYRSESIARQLVDGGYLADINLVRAYVGDVALHP